MGAREQHRREAGRGGAIVLLVVLSACSTLRPPVGAHDLPSAAGPYAARFTGSLEWRGKGIPLTGLLAVVPGTGARLEIRDPLGGVLLVAFVGPRACTLLRPADGAQASWGEAGGDLPFSAGDLWFLLTGAPPSRAMDTRSRGGLFEARWRNGAGRVEMTADTAGDGPAPFDAARMRGPRGAQLRLTLAAPQAAQVPEEALRPPPPSATASPSNLLDGLAP
jgi:hypothetical protein